MILLSLIQSLLPSGYFLEKKKQYRGTQDVDHIDGQSIEEMMGSIGVGEDQYHENHEIV
jgi:hypothetical protein